MDIEQFTASVRQVIGDAQKVALRRHHQKMTDLHLLSCLLYTSPSPRDATLSRMPSSA